MAAVGAALALGSWALVRALEDRLVDDIEHRNNATVEALAQTILHDNGDPIIFGSTGYDGPDPAGSDEPVEIGELLAAIGAEPGATAILSQPVSLDGAYRTTTTLRWYLSVIVPLLVLGVGALTWRLTGWALQTVDRIRRDVDEITHTSLHRRVAGTAAADEITALTNTVNDMLDRLETAANQQQQFVADASHELRSPLGTIRASLEVAGRADRPVSWEHAADVAITEVDRLSSLVDDLLYTAHQRPPAPTQTVDLDEIVLAEVSRLRVLGRDGDSHVEAARLHGNHHELARLVRNLVDNAHRHARRTVRLILTADDSHIVLTVDDDGPGIAPNDRQRIFERFTRLDEARARDEGGSGLGLAIASSIANDHHGTLTADPSPNGGARFTLILPTQLKEPL